jgi:DNA-binding response OmpR family regulator
MNQENASILVVDDEESIRNILSRRLKAEGYYCEAAADGAEALSKASKKIFDLVLADIKMPVMSGIELLSRMQTEHPDVSVLMITAVVDTKVAVEAMKMGAYDFVTKPFDLDDLNIRVKRALERRGLVLENREYQLRLEQKVEQQVGQIRQYCQEAIQALSREQIARQELEAVRRPVNVEAVPGAEVGLKSSESSSGVEEFAQKLTQLFSAPALTQLFSAPARDVSKEKGINRVPVQTKTINKITQEQPPPNKEKANIKEALALYKGTIELAILPPVSLQQILQLHEHLRPITQMNVLNLGGSVDKGITIRICIATPIPLLKILRDLPEVEKASDELEETERIVPARQEEGQKVRRIVVVLFKKLASDTIDSVAG